MAGCDALMMLGHIPRTPLDPGTAAVMLRRCAPTVFSYSFVSLAATHPRVTSPYSTTDVHCRPGGSEVLRSARRPRRRFDRVMTGLTEQKLGSGYHKGYTPMIRLQEGNKGGHKRLHAGVLPRSLTLPCHGVQ